MAKKAASTTSGTKKKAASKKAAPKKAAAKKTTKKAATKTKAAPKKAATKKAAAKKTASKKAATKKAAAKKADASKKAASSTKQQASASTSTAKKTTKASTSKAAASRSSTGTRSSSRNSTRSSVTKSTDTLEIPAWLGDEKWLAAQREALLEERRRQTNSAETREAEAAALMADREPGDVQFDEESGEGDTLAVERDRDLALSARARELVSEIDAALARIDAGTYGICASGEDIIPKERLEYVPQASKCVRHQTSMF